jgi:predicted TIM-barrel fold metal-dependent hydrolase
MTSPLCQFLENRLAESASAERPAEIVRLEAQIESEELVEPLEGLDGDCGNLGTDAVARERQDLHWIFMILPSQALPERATDCHMHVFGPFERYPLADERAYNVPEAPLEAHERMKRRVGLERTVLVQASGHGSDNRAMLAALAQLGARGRAVAVLDPPTPASELEKMHACGVRGLRLNLVSLASRYGGDHAQRVADYEGLLAPFGWHLQVFARATTLQALEPALARCKVNIVIDHMGLPDAARGIAQPGFEAVLRLLAAGHVWVKLAGADRITRASGRLRDAIAFMQALVAAAPERLVWGSDWPHIGFHSGQQVRGDAVLPYRDIDAGELLEVLIAAVPDSETRRAILADNPAKLYGFGA